MAVQAELRVPRERWRDARAPGGIGTVSLSGSFIPDPRRSLAGTGLWLEVP